MQVLEWENMLAALDEDHPERAHFTCEGCGASIEEHHRPKMLRGAKWVASNPKMKRVHRSFYLWSAYSLLQSFERIARSWLSAKGDPPKEQTFWNDVVGKAYRVLGEAPPWEDIRDRAAESDYSHGNIPAGYPMLTCGVDCQGDRVEWQVVAWGQNSIELGVSPRGAFWAGRAERPPQPVGAPVQHEPHLIGVGLRARGPVRGEMALPPHDVVLGLAAR
jgi:phage terminase large subunit GpA-like protein